LKSLVYFGALLLPSLALAVGAYNEPNSLALVEESGKLPSSVISVDWSDIQGVPAGLADGVDDTGGADSITPAGTVASSVVGTQFDNRPAFVKVIFCGKD